MDSKRYDSQKGILILLMFFAILLLTYSPVVETDYAHHDDYQLMFGKPGEFMASPIAWIRAGRPVTGLMHAIVKPRTFELAKLSRLIGIVGVTLLAFAVFRWFKINHMGTTNAFLLSLLIGTLPAFQVYVSWMTDAYYPYAALLSACSAIILFKGAFKKRGSVLCYAVATVCLLVIALSIYQPAAMIYWALLAVPLTKRKILYWKKLQRPMALYFSVGFIALAIYHFFIVNGLCRIILERYYGVHELTRRASFVGVNDIVGKIYWFFTDPVVCALNLVNVFPFGAIAAAVGIVVLAGFALDFFKTIGIKDNKYKKTDLFWSYIQRSLLIGCLVLLTFLISLAIDENLSLHRTLVALTSITAILFYRGFDQIASALPVQPHRRKTIKSTVFALVVVVSIWTANYNVMNYYAFPSAVEFGYLKSIIKQNYSPDVKRIHLIRPSSNGGVAKRSRYDEFGTPSSYFQWNPGYMVVGALKELNLNRGDIQITHGSIIPLKENILVVDMRKLKDFR